MKGNIHQSDAAQIQPSFRQLLQTELARRCSQNSKYSLRAFAKHLGADHSTLSQLLRGKRPFSSQSIRRFGQRLGVDHSDISRYIDRERRRSSNDLQPCDKEIQQLTQDIAYLVADWHHYAILELVRLDGFRPDSRWIARVLGISVDEVNVALQCLVRLGLLEMVSANQWVDHLGDAMASIRGFTQVGIERYLEQFRKLTLRSLQSNQLAGYEVSMTTLAIDSHKVPEALEIIARFRRELAAFLEQSSQRDEVYQLQITFVPISRTKQGDSAWAPPS